MLRTFLVSLWSPFHPSRTFQTTWGPLLQKRSSEILQILLEWEGQRSRTNLRLSRSLRTRWSARLPLPLRRLRRRMIAIIVLKVRPRAAVLQKVMIDVLKQKTSKKLNHINLNSVIKSLSILEFRATLTIEVTVGLRSISPPTTNSPRGWFLIKSSNLEKKSSSDFKYYSWYFAKLQRISTNCPPASYVSNRVCFKSEWSRTPIAKSSSIPSLQ